MNDFPRMLGDRYEVHGVLGRGGMAEVHEGRDTRLGRRVAIKVLRPDMARDPVFQARFRREAQSAAGLNHPAIVAVYDTGEDVHTDAAGNEARLPYIVMEHVEGRTVRDVLIAAGGHGLGTQRAAAITAGVLTALDYSHRQGIIHRDIKPANVMITPSGDIKVMDFGIARAIADTSATMTQTSAVIGTAQYLSPEQARGETVDARSDLYSTGCLLYELLTGRPPFIGESPVSVAYQHVGEVPQPPSVHNPAVDDEMDRVVLKALAKDREDRYDDAEQFRADLLAAEEGRPVTAPAVAVATATATHALPTTSEATRALVGAGFSPPSGPARAVFGDAPPAGTGPVAAQPEPPRRRRTGLVVMWVLIALLLLAAAGWGLSRYVAMSNRIAVPAVKGENLVQAESEIADAGFSDPKEVREPDDAPNGTVLAVSPSSGTKVDPATRITLTVSSGPASVKVPDVGKQTDAQAQQTLTSAGLVAGSRSFEASADVPQGSVIRSDPAAGATVKPGSTVALVLSNGQVTLPQLTGSGLADAQAQLKELGLSFALQQVTSTQPVGTVIDQSPEAGLVAAGTQVTLYVVTQQSTPTPTDTPTPSDTATDGESPTSSPSGSSSSPSSSKTKSSASPTKSGGKGGKDG